MPFIMSLFMLSKDNALYILYLATADSLASDIIVRHVLGRASKHMTSIAEGDTCC